MAKKSKTKIDRDHEREIEMLKILQGPSGFDTLLFMGMAAGYGIAGAAKFMANYLGIDVKPDGSATDKDGMPVNWGKILEGFAIAGPGGAFLMGPGSGGDNVDGILGLAQSVPASLGHACLFLLTVRSIFGTSSGDSTGGGSGLLSGIL